MLRSPLRQARSAFCECVPNLVTLLSRAFDVRLIAVSPPLCRHHAKEADSSYKSHDRLEQCSNLATNRFQVSDEPKWDNQP